MSKTRVTSKKSFEVKTRKAEKLKREEPTVFLDTVIGFMRILMMGIWSLGYFLFAPGPHETFEHRAFKSFPKGEKTETEKALLEEVKELNRELKKMVLDGKEREKELSLTISLQLEKIEKLKERNRTLKQETSTKQKERDNKLNAELEKRWKNKYASLEKIMAQKHSEEMEEIERKHRNELNQVKDQMKEEVGSSESMVADADEGRKTERLQRSMMVVMKTNFELSNQIQSLVAELEEKNMKIDHLEQQLKETKTEEECSVCLSAMNKEEEDLIACEHCQKQYHDKCLSNWLEISHTCPSCRGHTLDLRDFPDLV